MRIIRNLLLYKWHDYFPSLVKFWPSERNTENTVSDLYFNEENGYSEENTSGNEGFCSITLQPFLFDAEQKKECGNARHDKETQHIHASAANLLHIRIGNLDWYKCLHCKNEAREIDCLCCRKVDAMLISSVKIPEREWNVSPSSVYGQLPNYYSHVFALSN